MIRLRARHIALCTFLALCLYLTLPGTKRALGVSGNIATGGTADLSRYMNDVTQIPHIAAIASSFAWSTVPFTHPPPLAPEIPRSIAKRPRIQHRFRPDTPTVAAEQDTRRREVLRVTQKAWDAYRKNAWMKDALKPLSGTHFDQFSGWAATLVDSLDTLWIMGLKEEFYEAVAAVATIDFGRSTSASVNTFETCIRYLGGLIGAYDLSGHEALRVKAIEVGDFLYAAFNTANNMPVDFISFEHAKTGAPLQVESMVVIASPGTIILEFGRLSQITGDSKYYAAADAIMETFREAQNSTRIPGLWPMMVSMRQKDLVSGSRFTMGGGADSMYEYITKAHALLHSTDASSMKYESMARTFMDTAIEHLVFRPMTRGNEDILISGQCDARSGVLVPEPESEHLTCFVGGMYALGGRLFENATYLDIGAKLARGCMYAYKSFPTGIMPERYNMISCPGPDAKQACAWDDGVWQIERAKRPEYRDHLPKGFTTAKDPRYILRPEAIESVFVLWRLTGDGEYREAAWNMFQTIVNATDTPLANAAIDDVTVVGSRQTDFMESFWIAETLKYFYLVFASTDLISLDDFVLNTEAHPFRLPTGRYKS